MNVIKRTCIHKEQTIYDGKLIMFSSKFAHKFQPLRVRVEMLRVGAVWAAAHVASFIYLCHYPAIHIYISCSWLAYIVLNLLSLPPALSHSL